MAVSRAEYTVETGPRSGADVPDDLDDHVAGDGPTCRPEVLPQTIRDGVALLTWESDTFAYADGYDEAAKRYRGLRAGEVVTLSVESGGLLVKGDVAHRPHRRLGSRR